MNRALPLLLLSCLAGCVWATLPLESKGWDDASPIFKLNRADIVRAESAVVSAMVEQGIISDPKWLCAYDLATSITDTAYQVIVAHRPGLCSATPDQTTKPKFGNGADDGPLYFMVDKGTFRVLRQVPSSEPSPKEASTDPAPPPEVPVAQAAPAPCAPAAVSTPQCSPSGTAGWEPSACDPEAILLRPQRWTELTVAERKELRQLLTRLQQQAKGAVPPSPAPHPKKSPK